LTFQNKRLTGIVLAAAVLLMTPVAARFPWSLADFIVAGVLLLATGLAIETAMRLRTRFEYRIAAVAALLTALFLIWVEIAVGLFGTPFAGS
jgi:hypothetical protein